MQAEMIPTIDGVLPRSKTQLRKAIQHRPAAVAVDILTAAGWDTVGLGELPPGTHRLETFEPPMVLLVEVTEEGAIRVRL
jgi:hypothetical protein